jgi:raffinose/stachyose/melibiose transport system substrate-binding protein
MTDGTGSGFREKQAREIAAGFTRRAFLRRMSAAALLAGGTGGLLAACGGDDEAAPATGATPPAPVEGGELTVWYLSSGTDPEADERYFEQIGATYRERRGTEVTFVAQTLENFITAWKSAVAAEEGPDLQYLWEGVYTLEDAWRGTIEPHSAYTPGSETDNWLARYSVIWDDALWSAPDGLDGLMLMTNGALFERAGLDPEAPLESWEEFTGACAALKAEGITPIGLGLKDAFGGGWLYSTLARSNLNSVAEATRAIVGDEDIADEKHSEWWFRLAELRDEGYFNDNISSVGLFDALSLFPQQRAAMLITAAGTVRDLTAEFSGDASMIRVRPELPRFGEGTLATKAVTIFSGGFVIAGYSESQEAAAQFAAFLHEPSNVDRRYQDTGSLPADARLDRALLGEQWQKDFYDAVVNNPGPWLEDWIPTQVASEAIYSGCQALFAGESPEDQVERTKQTVEQWREQNPDLVDAYLKWVPDAEEVYS